MREIHIAAGRKTQIIRRQFSSLATTYVFDARPEIPENYLAGVVEIQGSSWIFPKPSKTMPLQSSNRVTAGVWDTFFSVHVTPEVDIVVSLPSKPLNPWLWVIPLLSLIIGMAIALILLT